MTELDGQGPGAFASVQQAYELSKDMGLVDRVKTLGESAVFLLKNATLRQAPGAEDYYEPDIQLAGKALVERANARSAQHNTPGTLG